MTDQQKGPATDRPSGGDKGGSQPGYRNNPSNPSQDDRSAPKEDKSSDKEGEGERSNPDSGKPSDR